MTDREALAAALEEYPINRTVRQRILIDDSAEERLAQLPEKCGTCDGNGAIQVGDAFPYCPTCHGSGKVYPAELVERVARAIGTDKPNHAWAIAVLDALNGETG